MTQPQEQGASAARTAGQVAFEAFCNGPQAAQSWSAGPDAGRQPWERVAAAVIEHAALASRADSAEMTAGAMISLPLDDPKRPLNDSGLPSAMIWAGGEAYDEMKADKALDLDSCSLAVGIYRAMTEAHAREIATLTPPAGLKFDPAPATPPGVPDSVRALSEAAKPGQLRVSPTHWGFVGLDAEVTPEQWDGNLRINGKPHLSVLSDRKEGLDYADAAFLAAAWNHVRASAHPAGQSAGLGAWAEHSPQEIVRRTRCMADESRDAVVWRDCCDLIHERLSKPAPDSTRTGPVGTEGEPCEDDITAAMIQAGRYAANLNDGTLARIYLAMRTVEWKEAQKPAPDSAGTGLDRERIPLSPGYHAEPGETFAHLHDVYTTIPPLCGWSRIHVGTLMKQAVEAWAATAAPDSTRTGTVGTEDLVETVARAIFEADEDLNDASEAELRAKGNHAAADCLAGPRARWDDPKNAPILDAFRYRAKKAIEAARPATAREGQADA